MTEEDIIATDKLPLWIFFDGYEDKTLCQVEKGNEKLEKEIV